VLFSNVKHLFFQPCDNELVVLIHFHLKSPIMIGKKKTKDIQFFREATDMQFDETGNRKRKFRYGDEDEIEMEQAERARRSKMNKEFKAFAEKISDAASTSVRIRYFAAHQSLLDTEYRRASLLKWISHTSNWRLKVFHTARTSDSPRPWTVWYTLPNRPSPLSPYRRLKSPPSNVCSLVSNNSTWSSSSPTSLDRPCKSTPSQVYSLTVSRNGSSERLYFTWLRLVFTIHSDVDVPLSESRVNYNWGPIMKTINEDPYRFFADGGWSFLTGPGEPSDHETEESEVDSEYSEEGSQSESEPSESEFSGSAVSDEDSDMGSAEDDDGDDWDEMERKAAKCKRYPSCPLACVDVLRLSADKKKLENGKGHRSDDDEVPRKKKPAQKNGKASGSKRRR